MERKEISDHPLRRDRVETSAAMHVHHLVAVMLGSLMTLLVAPVAALAPTAMRISAASVPRLNTLPLFGMCGPRQPPWIPLSSVRAAKVDLDQRWPPHEISRQPCYSRARARARPPCMASGGVVILGKRAWQVGLAGIICVVLLRELAVLAPPRLFALHVAFMAPMLPLAAAAMVTVRQRLVPSKVKLTGPGARKRRSEWLVIRHFLTSATAAYAASAGVVAIFLHKESRGARHLTTLHSWLGAGTWVIWMAAYAAAQPHVWRDQWRARKFSLWTNKRWLWASVTHRRLGTLAYALSLAAYATGALGWAALDRNVAAACCVAVAAIGTTSLGQHGAREVGRAARTGMTWTVGVGRRVASWRVRSSEDE